MVVDRPGGSLPRPSGRLARQVALPIFPGLNSTPGGSVGPGGDWNGGTNARLGGRDVTIRGAVASEGGANASRLARKLSSSCLVFSAVNWSAPSTRCD